VYVLKIIPDQDQYKYGNLVRKESSKETVPQTAVSIIHGEKVLLPHTHTMFTTININKKLKNLRA